MTDVRLGYAWQNGSKFYLSVIGPKAKLARRPANEYNSRDALNNAAAQRGLTVTWETPNA